MAVRSEQPDWIVTTCAVAGANQLVIDPLAGMANAPAGQPWGEDALVNSMPVGDGVTGMRVPAIQLPSSIERVVLDAVRPIAPAARDRFDLLSEDVLGLDLQVTAERVVMEALAPHRVDDVEPGPVSAVNAPIRHQLIVPTGLTAQLLFSTSRRSPVRRRCGHPGQGPAA